jgi:hypothetical protein
MKDMTSGVLLKRAISPTRVTDNTAQASVIIDRQGFDTLTFGILIGTLADSDAAFAVAMTHGDTVDDPDNPASITDSGAVDDDMMVSQTPGTAPETAAAFGADDDDEVRKVGYVGDKRYVRLTITPSANSGNADIAAFALLGHPMIGPVTQGAS